MVRDHDTSVVAVVLLTPASFAIPAFRGPVGHATELVAFGVWRIRNAFEGGFGGRRWSPGVVRGEG